MTTTIQAGHMAGVCRNYLKTRQVINSQHPDGDFIRRMAAIFAETEHASGNGNTARIQTGSMTLEEYKKYISGKIYQIPSDPSARLDTVQVRISDEGFAAMKQDPEYEAWVLDTVKGNITAADPWSGLCGGRYIILSFGAAPEESRVESWRAGFMNGRESSPLPGKSEKGFWERRAESRKQLAEQWEEMQDLKELNRDWQKGMYYGPAAVLKVFQPKAGKGGGM